MFWAGIGLDVFQILKNCETTALRAPVSQNTFQKWQRDGQDFTTNQSATVIMNSDHTMTAVYVSPPTFALTVASSNPSSGVNITVTPNDRNGSGDGTTQFTRTYNQNSNVNLTAPATVGASSFWKWQVDGVDYIQAQFATFDTACLGAKFFSVRHQRTGRSGCAIRGKTAALAKHVP